MEKIGELLIRKDLITAHDLSFSLSVQEKTGQKIGKILQYYNFLDDDSLAKNLAEQIGWRYFDQEYIPDWRVADDLTVEFLCRHMIFPAKAHDAFVFVVGRIDDTELTDYLFRKGYTDVEFAIGSETAIGFALDLLSKQARREIVSYDSIEKNKNIDVDDLRDWFLNILDDALAQGATDIHVEPSESVTEIRVRIDGILYFMSCLPRKLHSHLINLIFYEAHITVSDFYRFHDARFNRQYRGRSVDIRLSCLPTIYGAAVVLRLMDRDKTVIPLTALGYCRKHWDLIDGTLKVPYGMILVTGPTGSGKTTTLYAMLNCLKSLSTKIVTIEDPVEVKVPLLTQVQINEKQGITFSKATRAFLRHDPDIILIGEIRDLETAREAIRAAMTGHKVFSTLHTNTPVDSLVRLFDLGVDFSLIAYSLAGIISQRLIRKLCPFCKTKIIVKKQELSTTAKKYFHEDIEYIFKAKGCSQCMEGYSGRTVAAEVLCVDAEIQRLIAAGKIDAIREKITGDPQYMGMVKDASRLIKSGITSLEEVVRVIG